MMNREVLAEAMTHYGVDSVDELMSQLEEHHADGGCEATDGCWVEPDGHCQHGCPSWLVKLGVI